MIAHFNTWVNAHLLLWYMGIILFIQSANLLMAWWSVRQHRKVYTQYKDLTAIQGQIIKTQDGRIRALEDAVRKFL